MLFNSLEFLILLAISLLLYWLSPSIFWRQNTLLVASIIFYAYWFPPYLILFLTLAIFTYIFGLRIAQEKRRSLFLSVSFLVVILCIFKYTNFILDIFKNSLDIVGLDFTFSPIDIRLPLGISFIVFELISYLADIKLNKTTSEKDIRLFTLFLAFFPHLIAGPICRTNQLIPQFHQKLPFNLHQFIGGLVLLTSGLFLKVCFADGLAPFVNSVFNSTDGFVGKPTLWASIGFGVQIFCDFWGYSTMAVGSAQLFGIDIPINFNLPYISTSLREFWRRWHITLSNWIRDYLYIPLGGSRKGQLQTASNLIITMGLCGLWHGASFNFIIWGLLHGLFLVIERFCSYLFPNIQKTILGRTINFIWPPVGWLITMSFVFITWIFFRANTLTDALAILNTLVTPAIFLPTTSPPRSFFILLLAFVVIHIPLNKLMEAMHTEKIRVSWRFVIAGWLFILSIVMSSGESLQFIYFEF
ncbi:MAG: MBOAT family protein [Desmonostoc vinosum HA7617-LM4]|jgi:D-alanyl-lipoteichoic acid acyltransferase DltB (MBOAT superfamily)|nr:MBOAT family protein [Desmonostoc vinosum HA7617-LM4]